MTNQDDAAREAALYKAAAVWALRSMLEFYKDASPDAAESYEDGASAGYVEGYTAGRESRDAEVARLRAALEEIRARGVQQKLVGLVLAERAVMRSHQRVVTPFGDGAYHVIYPNNGLTPAGGIVYFPKAVRGTKPAGSVVYVEVDDLDAALASFEAAGGSVRSMTKEDPHSSAVVAEVNHFVPWSRQVSPSRTASVSLCETSEPPVRSVIHCPLVQNTAGSREVRCGRARSISAWSPMASRQRAAPSVMASGHE